MKGLTLGVFAEDCCFARELVRRAARWDAFLMRGVCMSYLSSVYIYYNMHAWMYSVYAVKRII